MSIIHTEYGERLDQLEAEIRRLRRSVAAPSPSLGVRLAAILKVAVANWVLISFLAALAIAIYVKRYVNVFTREQKTAFAHYALSFDKALAGDLDAANRELRAARALDADGRFRMFFANKVAAIASFVQVPPHAREWFVDLHSALLRPQFLPPQGQ